MRRDAAAGTGLDGEDTELSVACSSDGSVKTVNPIYNYYLSDTLLNIYYHIIIIITTKGNVYQKEKIPYKVYIYLFSFSYSIQSGQTKRTAIPPIDGGNPVKIGSVRFVWPIIFVLHC